MFQLTYFDIHFQSKVAIYCHAKCSLRFIWFYIFSIMLLQKRKDPRKNLFLSKIKINSWYYAAFLGIVSKAFRLLLTFKGPLKMERVMLLPLPLHSPNTKLTRKVWARLSVCFHLFVSSGPWPKHKLQVVALDNSSLRYPLRPALYIGSV